MNKKIIFIPGWLNTLETYKKYDGLEIWDEKTDYKKEIEADFVIGHSMGANFTLLNYCHNKKNKIILINPLLHKKNFLFWLWRFFRFHHKEGIYPQRKLVKGFGKYLRAFLISFALIKYDLLNILKSLNKDDVYVLRGKKDYFFCDEKAVEYIKAQNLNIIEVDEAGHNWHEKFNDEIRKIISN